MQPNELSNPLQRGPGEHSILIGQTGTGKSTLARYLLDSERYNVIVDPKGDFELPGWMITEPAPGARRTWFWQKTDEVNSPEQNAIILDDPGEAAAAIREREHNVVYRPAAEFIDSGCYEDVYRAVYDTRDLDCYTDEAQLVCESSRSFPKWYRASYQQGRGRGIRMTSGSQRPSWLPLFTFSEAKHFYVFGLLLVEDKKRAESWLGWYERPGDEHAFWYRNVKDRTAKQYVLKL